MNVEYSVRVFVDGGTKEDVSRNLPDFFRYLIDAVGQARSCGGVVSAKTFIQNSPAKMTFVMLIPDVYVLEYAATHNKPLATEIHHTNMMS